MNKLESFAALMRRHWIVTIAAVLLFVGLIATACSHGAPSGYHDMNKLQNNIALTEQQDSGIAVTNVKCIPTGANTASCFIQGANGQQITVQVDISPDGSTWVSH